MNTVDVLFYGNRTLMNAIEGLAKRDWEEAGVCGVWSVRNILAHLASYELMHRDVLQSFVEQSPTPMLKAYIEMRSEFNDIQVEERSELSTAQTMEEYLLAHEKVMGYSKKIPSEILGKPGTLPWYGEEYTINDFLVYTSYGHKREHSAQIWVFRDKLQAR